MHKARCTSLKQELKGRPQSKYLAMKIGEDMATYKEIQAYIKRKHGIAVKTCWIAHVKEMCGLNPRIASNRHSLKERVNPCPPNKVAIIKDAFKHFGMK
jgi:hypothetical protein